MARRAPSSRVPASEMRRSRSLLYSRMPLAKIRRLADLVREGPGNEQQRLELLHEKQRRVANQLAELSECLRIINRKVGIYEQHLADGTAQNLWTAKA